MNTPAELEKKLATVTSLAELDGLAKQLDAQLDAQNELHETARQMITTRRAEIMRAQRR